MPKSKNTKKIIVIVSLFIFLGMFFIATNHTLAADTIRYKAQIGFGEIFSKEIEIGPDSIGTYITEIYKYAVSVVGILASIVIMWGGVRWLTAGGDKGAVDDAKKWIEGALSGLILVMTSYMILYFVNPDLIKFKSIKIDKINNSKTTENKTNTQYCSTFKTDTTALNWTSTETTTCYESQQECYDKTKDGKDGGTFTQCTPKL